MATLAQRPATLSTSDEPLFLRSAILMALVIVAGFSLNYAMGRSSFGAPLRVHLHAVLFMGWVGIYLLQNAFAASDRLPLHRTLGWIAAAWLVPMLVMGFVVTIAMVRGAHVPFVFTPLQFLIFDPLTLLTFVGLTIAAILLRRRTEWHRRLHYCGMSMLLVPAFGRLLPLPLLDPWAWEACFAASLLFPIGGAWLDSRRRERTHPAWYYGIAAMLASFLLVETITYSAAGMALYGLATKGSPGASVAPLSFPAPPPAALPVTGSH